MLCILFVLSLVLFILFTMVMYMYTVVLGGSSFVCVCTCCMIRGLVFNVGSACGMVEWFGVCIRVYYICVCVWLCR